MNLTLIKELSWRYLKGKRGANAVPVLSRISMVAIGVGAAAMIILFSVFNGFEGLVKDLYKAFYPDVRITASKGKFFNLNDNQLQSIQELDGITAISCVIEDNVLLNSSSDEKRVARLKGVDKNYFKVNSIKEYISNDNVKLITQPVRNAIIGEQLLNQLGLDVNNVFSIMEAFYPNPKISPSEMAQSPDRAFNSIRLRPDATFTVQDDFDGSYVLADISIVQELLQEPNKYSSLEIAVANSGSVSNVIKQIQQELGDEFVVQNRFEQNQSLYMIMSSEKWAVYGILVLVLMIAAFNMVGALSLLVLEKQKDIGILKAMGARDKHISSIFLAEGALWAFIGGGGGLLLGIILCLCQQQFGWITLGGSFIIEAYPVRLHISDILVVLGTILVIGLLASWFPAVRANKVQAISLKTD